MISPRETEIVRIVTVEASRKRAASKLGISLKTVDSHLTRVFRKLGITSLVELTHWALASELIDNLYETREVISQSVSRKRGDHAR